MTETRYYLLLERAHDPSFCLLPTDDDHVTVLVMVSDVSG